MTLIATCPSTTINNSHGAIQVKQSHLAPTVIVLQLNRHHIPKDKCKREHFLLMKQILSN